LDHCPSLAKNTEVGLLLFTSDFVFVCCDCLFNSLCSYHGNIFARDVTYIVGTEVCPGWVRITRMVYCSVQHCSNTACVNIAIDAD